MPLPDASETATARRRHRHHGSIMQGWPRSPELSPPRTLSGKVTQKRFHSTGTGACQSPGRTRQIPRRVRLGSRVVSRRGLREAKVRILHARFGNVRLSTSTGLNQIGQVVNGL
jgi:hypothetical protein